MDRPNKNRRPAGKQGSARKSDSKSYSDRKRNNRPSAEDHSASSSKSPGGRKSYGDQTKDTRSGRGNASSPSKTPGGKKSYGPRAGAEDESRDSRPGRGKYQRGNSDSPSRPPRGRKSLGDRNKDTRPNRGEYERGDSETPNGPRGERKSFGNPSKDSRPARGKRTDAGARGKSSSSKGGYRSGPKAGADAEGGKARPFRKPGTRPDGKPFKNPSGNAGGKRPKRPRPSDKPSDGSTRLNKFLAHAGIASRREADKLIATRLVKVNGKVVTEMGYKVKPNDDVRFNDTRITPEKKVYVLLNKPKDFITTVDDPQNRRTVMQLIQGAGPERLYPVGRLDRMTTGLLMFTNDGELAKRLTHPRYNVRKVYHVVLDQPLKPNHLDDIRRGIQLEGGPISADEISYIEEADNRKEVGIEIHSGRNRIVRRIFEHLGYSVVKLDRVVFANLTKRNLKRGQWRFLTREELQQLAMLGKGK